MEQNISEEQRINPKSRLATGRCPECASRLNIFDANMHGAGTIFECRNCKSPIRKTTTGRGLVIIAFISTFVIQSEYGFISNEYALSMLISIILIIIDQAFRSKIETVS